MAQAVRGVCGNVNSACKLQGHVNTAHVVSVHAAFSGQSVHAWCCGLRRIWARSCVQLCMHARCAPPPLPVLFKHPIVCIQTTARILLHFKPSARRPSHVAGLRPMHCTRHQALHHPRAPLHHQPPTIFPNLQSLGDALLQTKAISLHSH